ncbi:DUF6479 family protein [Streptomyces sp. NPDC005813]|uniref:DUF6479 family protein n=1 Tax=Streptomyces sp. NPDC005813 TaxID=3155592 RepID=UPI0033FD1141
MISTETTASAATAGALAVLVGGLIVVGALIWAVRFGIKVRRSESAVPRRGQHPTLPESGPVHESREMREANEVPRAHGKGERLTPHELRHSASRRSDDQRRSRWDSGTGGDRSDS